MDQSPVRNIPRSWIVAGVCILAMYLILTIGTAFTERPGIDEGYFANPAFNLVTKGVFSTTVLETFGTNFKGMDRHTYWIMPLQPLTLAGWYKIFGFGVFSTRVLSILWGLVAMVAIFLIARSLFGRPPLGLLVVGLLSVDYIFIVCASSGRMDMMSAALGFSALATYLCLRERNLLLALLVGQSFVVASGLTHPMGLMPFFALAFMSLYLDRKRLGLKHVGVALVPYVIGGLAWGSYIAQDPSAFFSQFAANATMGSDENIGGRFVGLLAPFRGLRLEITHRYLSNFGFSQRSIGLANLKIFLLAFYFIGLVGTLLIGEIRRLPNYRLLLGLTVIYFLGLSFIDSQKAYYYLVHIVPFYLIMFGLFVTWLWTRRGSAGKLILLPLAGVAVLGIGGLAYRIKQNNYGNGFKPAAEFLRGRASDQALIAAGSGVAFGLGFPSNVTHDPVLGFHSGKRFDYIVLDPEFAYSIRTSEGRSPETYTYTKLLLTDSYEKIYDHANYEVFVRR